MFSVICKPGRTILAAPGVRQFLRKQQHACIWGASACAASSSSHQRSFNSTQPLASEAITEYDESEAPEHESHFCLILGPPGGGKGTISKKMLADFPKFHHVSTGDILRQHVRYETSLGLKAKAYMDRGGLVPDDLMIELVMEDATPFIDEGKSLLLDGFPRTIDQAIHLEMVTHIDMVINLNVPTETIVDRIADRWIHPASGRVYSYSYHPPKVEGIDDETGEPLVQRDDDKPEAVRKRLSAYDQVTAPLVDYYAKQGVLKTFTGTKSDVIYPSVKSWLEEKNC